MSGESDFSNDIRKLIKILRKIMKNHPLQDKLPDPDRPGSQDFNLNVFIFPFLPVTSEELEELEQMCESVMFDPEKDKEADETDHDLSPSDLEFLRRHGIRY